MARDKGDTDERKHWKSPLPSLSVRCCFKSRQWGSPGLMNNSFKVLAALIGWFWLICSALADWLALLLQFATYADKYVWISLSVLLYNTICSYLDSLSLAHPCCHMEGRVVVVQLSHRAQLDTFIVIQKDLKMEMENVIIQSSNAQKCIKLMVHACMVIQADL